MRAAVTGGTGFIGSRVVAALEARGDTVAVLSRSREGISAAGTRFIRGDLSDPSVRLDELLAGADVVFHCAGEISAPARMESLHVGGTSRLVAAAQRESSRTGRRLRWIQLSSVGAYGPPRPNADTPRVVTEQTPVSPVGEYEQSKTRSDELVIAAAAAAAIDVVVLRPSNVYGAGMPNGSLRAVASLVRSGVFVLPGRGRPVATYIHVDDVVDALLRCALDERAAGEVFNLSNDCALEDLIRGMAGALGVKVKILRLPRPLLRGAARLISAVGSTRLTPERVDALSGQTTYPATKIESILGIRRLRSVPETIVEATLPKQR